MVGREFAEETAGKQGITLHGGRGVIGALAAVALSGLPNEILLSPEQNIPP
jgi:tRNA(Ile2) C34 agmatinyltransferase TiaS